MVDHPIPQPPQRRYSFRPFPSYRFVVGEGHPHPTADPQGHSFGKEDNAEILTRDNWDKNEDYLYGVDLYNYAYWWEAHEAFEELWAHFSRGSAESDLLQGIIKISAAFYKWHLHNAGGVKNHYAGGTRLLEQAMEYAPVYMGIDLQEYLDRLARHFALVLSAPDTGPDPLINYPFIILNKNPL